MTKTVMTARPRHRRRQGGSSGFLGDTRPGAERQQGGFRLRAITERRGQTERSGDGWGAGGRGQDGGVGGVGQVETGVNNGWIKVKWLKSQESNDYRAGPDKQDLAVFQLSPAPGEEAGPWSRAKGRCARPLQATPHHASRAGSRPPSLCPNRPAYPPHLLPLFHPLPPPPPNVFRYAAQAASVRTAPRPLQPSCRS